MSEPSFIKVTEHALEGTTICLVPSIMNTWYVVDSTDQGTALTDALPLEAAKRAAMRIAQQRSAGT